MSSCRARHSACGSGGGFDGGVDVLNPCLKSLAAKHRGQAIATTCVMVDADQPAHIPGRYSLSAAALAFEQLADAQRNGLPVYPIPLDLPLGAD